MAIRHVSCQVAKRSTSAGQPTTLYQFPRRPDRARKRPRTLSSLRVLYRLSEGLARSHVTRYRQSFVCFLVSPRLVEGNIEQGERNAESTYERTYLKFYSVHRSKREFKVSPRGSMSRNRFSFFFARQETRAIIGFLLFIVFLARRASVFEHSFLLTEKDQESYFS